MRDPPRRHSDFQSCGAHALTFTDFKAISHEVAFFIAPSGRKGGVMDDVTMTPEMTPQGDSLPPDNITVVSEEDAAKAVEGLEKA